MDQLKFNRLKISQEVLDKYFKEMENPGKNRAYQHEDFPDTVFMQYQEKGEDFFTLISETDYKKIKGEYWSGTNNYVTTCRNGKTVYLHRELCPNLQDGEIAHHQGSKFNNQRGLVKAVTPKDHDQHRTYCGDLLVHVRY